MASSSRLFAPFRALGFVNSGVPFVVQQRQTKIYVTVGIGKAFQIYDCEKLSLLFVSPQLNSNITALAASGDYTFAACGCEVIVFHRAKEVGRLTGHTGPVASIISYGEAQLVTIAKDNTMRVWDWESEECTQTVEFAQGFTPACVYHPHTYLNKVVVGSKEGAVQLWNVRTGKQLYTFSGWGHRVTCFCQSPVVDVLGIGLADGRVVLHNLKFDETVATFTQTEGPVTGLSFRTDGQNVMVSACDNGDVALWNLDEKRLITVVKQVHDAEVTAVSFFNNQPVMLTGGGDNALKMWIFDQPDGEPRLLKSRSGHAAPPTRVRFYDGEGKHLLSAGLDKTFRVFSVIRDQLNRELSQGHVHKKARLLSVAADDLRLPPILDFDWCAIRERDWANLLTVHRGATQAYTWSYQSKAIGKHVLSTPKAVKPSELTCACISPCGNFGFVGSQAGLIHCFNMQSGTYRHSLPVGHGAAVTGVAVDSTNNTIMTCGLDGRLKYWDFVTREQLYDHDVGSPITQMIFSRENDLLSIACDDLVIRMYDSLSRRLVRRYAGHTNRITDMTYSNDVRTLVSCGMDMTVMVWDIPSGRLVDQFKTPKAPTGVTFSPTGEFLATTHVNSEGIYLWVNRQYYSNVAISSRKVKEAQVINMPSASGGLSVEEAQALEEETTPGNYWSDEEEEQDGSDAGLVVLSQLPWSKWQPLVNLDLIKQRNKPEEAPKAPEKAPFFLPTKAGLEPEFVAPSGGDVEDDKPKSRLINLGQMGTDSKFVRLLKEGSREQEYSGAMEHLKSLNPSAVDVEMRMLNMADLHYMVDMFTVQAGSVRDFELTQAYLNVFLKIHGSSIIASEDLVASMAGIAETQKHTWAKLQGQFQKSICMIEYLSNIQG